MVLNSVPTLVPPPVRGRCQLAAERGQPSASVFAGVAHVSLVDAAVSVNPSSL